MRPANFSKRLNKMLSGLDELENWIEDTLRQGLANLAQQPNFWKDMSARLFDAQLGGIGRRLKSLRFTIGSSTNWYEQVLAELSSYYLLLRGLRNLEDLPPPMQNDVLSLAGVATKTATLFEEGTPITDVWMVMATKEQVEDNLRNRQTWLCGWKTQRFALVLDFVWGKGVFTEQYVAGTIFEGTVFYYPSNAPLRVAVKDKKLIQDRPIKRVVGFPSISDFLDQYATLLGANPWLLTYPCAIEELIPVLVDGQLQLIDGHQQVLPILITKEQQWKIIALSGGHPINVFGEWTGKTLLPLSVSVGDHFISLLPS